MLKPRYGKMGWLSLDYWSERARLTSEEHNKIWREIKMINSLGLEGVVGNEGFGVWLEHPDDASAIAANVTHKINNILGTRNPKIEIQIHDIHKMMQQ